MKRRLPMAATTYLITLVAFVVLWLGITLLEARADELWRAAGNTGLESDQHALGILLARAHDQPWEAEELAGWHRETHPNLKFALYDATGELLTGHGVERLPRVRFQDVDWGGGDLVVLDDGVEVSRHDGVDGSTRYAVTRYVLSPGQWHVTYLGYGLGILLVALIWLVVAVTFGRLFGTPLRRMADTADELSAGNFSARIDIDRPDELGHLARALNQMAARLGGALEAQQVLMGQVSHELRTPLARLRVAVDLVEASDGEEARAQVLEMSHDLLELETLVSDVLALSRLDVAVASGSAKEILRRDTVEPSPWIASVIKRFQRTHPERALVATIPEDLPAFEADRVLLGRVLMNLLTNAHKYSPMDSPVHVEAAARREQLEVRVRDEGPGIPVDDLERVFEPFYRGRAASDSTTGGHGLGLSLCRRAARLHDGEVTIENRDEGGIEAVLWLPTARGGPPRRGSRWRTRSPPPPPPA